MFSRVRIAGALTTLAFLFLVGSVSAAPASIAATPESADIGSCSLVPSPGSALVTPVVTFATPQTDATTVYFTLFDASGKAIATQAVAVPAPPSVGLTPQLVAFTPPPGFETAQCTTKAPAQGVVPSPGGSGPNTGLILGVVGGAALIAVAASGHGGGGSPGSSSTPTPTPAPSPTATATATPTMSPAPGTLSLNPATLTFYAAGSAYDQSTTASQSGYFGAFSVSGTTCASSVATIAQSGATFTVTPVGAGATCTFTIAGGGGTSARLTVNVTTSNGTIDTKRAGKVK